MVLSTDEQIRWIMDKARKADTLFVLTYSFRPEGWVRYCLDTYDCMVFIAGPISLATLRDLDKRFPKASFTPIRGHHAKVYYLAKDNGADTALVTSLNFTPTTSRELGVTVQGKAVGTVWQESFHDIEDYVRIVPKEIIDRFDHVL